MIVLILILLGGFSIAYMSLCDYYSQPVIAEVIWVSLHYFDVWNLLALTKKYKWNVNHVSHFFHFYANLFTLSKTYRFYFPSIFWLTERQNSDMLAKKPWIASCWYNLKGEEQSQLHNNKTSESSTLSGTTSFVYFPSYLPANCFLLFFFFASLVVTKHIKCEIHSKENVSRPIVPYSFWWFCHFQKSYLVHAQ